jgi:FKBP-type peptidyl-prolyl cis-trans isomerase FklB
MIRSFLVATLVANMCAVSLASVTAADGGPGVVAPVAPAAGESAKWTNDQKASYLIGQQMAKRLKPFAADLDTALLIKSIQDVFADKPSVVLASEEQAVMQAFQEMMQGKEAKRAEGRVAENVKWLAANGKKDGVKTTATGLQYQVMATGAGKQAAMGKTVKVHYTGTLLDGSVFDSSVARGEPADFPLNPGGLIQGWLEAIPMMKEGDKWKLFIPSDLAYGQQGNQGIAPNSVLIFEVELIKVSGGEAGVPDAGIEAVPLGK